MRNRTAARRRPQSFLHYALGLLTLVGAATAILVVTRVEAHSSVHPDPTGQVSEPPGHDVPVTSHLPVTSVPPPSADTPVETRTAGPEPDRGAGTAAGGSIPHQSTRRLAEAGHHTRAAGPGRPDPDPPADLHRSLVWSGLLGLAISLTGLGIVGSRRRMW